jgi:hypothetical protein
MKNFEELRDWMTPEARARSEKKAAAMVAEMAPMEDQSAIPVSGSPASSPESNSSSPTASQD